jgi:hypothetical protein
MTDKWLMEPINREKAKAEWNKLRNHRTKIRQLNRKYPTAIYTAKLEIYRDLFHDSPELSKIIVQYLKQGCPSLVGGGLAKPVAESCEGSNPSPCASEGTKNYV